MARFSAHKSMLIRIEKLKRSVKVDTQRMRGKVGEGVGFTTSHRLIALRDVRRKTVHKTSQETEKRGVCGGYLHSSLKLCF